MSWDWNQPSSCNFSLAIWRPCCHTPAFYQCIQMVEKRGFGCQSYGAGSLTSLRRITRFSYYSHSHGIRTQRVHKVVGVWTWSVKCCNEHKVRAWGGIKLFFVCSYNKHKIRERRRTGHDISWSWKTFFRGTRSQKEQNSSMSDPEAVFLKDNIYIIDIRFIHFLASQGILEINFWVSILRTQYSQLVKSMIQF